MQKQALLYETLYYYYCYETNLYFSQHVFQCSKKKKMQMHELMNPGQEICSVNTNPNHGLDQ